MKTLVAVVVVLVSVVAEAAEPRLTPIEMPSGAAVTLGELVSRARASRTPSVIQLDGADDALLIPIAGNTAGGGGTYFRSDVTLTNDRLSAQAVGISWLVQGVDNRNASVQYYSLPANSFVALDDFVGTTLGRSGLGAIMIIAVNASGSPDLLAEIDGFSRIWTRQPGSSGSVSQSFASVDPHDSLGSLIGNIVGLKQSTAFRSNVGIVNLDSVAHTWTLRSAATGGQFTISVPPFSVVQAPVPSGFATSTGNLALTMASDGFGFWWSAYGTSVDNVTGDGWVSKASQ